MTTSTFLIRNPAQLKKQSIEFLEKLHNELGIPFTAPLTSVTSAKDRRKDDRVKKITTTTTTTATTTLIDVENNRVKRMNTLKKRVYESIRRDLQKDSLKLFNGNEGSGSGGSGKMNFTNDVIMDTPSATTHLQPSTSFGEDLKKFTPIIKSIPLNYIRMKKLQGNQKYTKELSTAAAIKLLPSLSASLCCKNPLEYLEEEFRKKYTFQQLRLASVHYLQQQSSNSVEVCDGFALYFCVFYLLRSGLQRDALQLLCKYEKYLLKTQSEDLITLMQRPSSDSRYRLYYPNGEYLSGDVYKYLVYSVLSLKGGAFKLSLQVKENMLSGNIGWEDELWLLLKINGLSVGKEYADRFIAMKGEKDERYWLVLSLVDRRELFKELFQYYFSRDDSRMFSYVVHLYLCSCIDGTIERLNDKEGSSSSSAIPQEFQYVDRFIKSTLYSYDSYEYVVYYYLALALTCNPSNDAVRDFALNGIIDYTVAYPSTIELVYGYLAESKGNAVIYREKGLLDLYLSPILLIHSEQEYLDKVLQVAAQRVKDLRSSILLFNLCQKYELVLDLYCKRLSETFSSGGGGGGNLLKYDLVLEQSLQVDQQQQQPQFNQNYGTTSSESLLAVYEEATQVEKYYSDKLVIYRQISGTSSYRTLNTLLRLCEYYMELSRFLVDYNNADGYFSCLNALKKTLLLPDGADLGAINGKLLQLRKLNDLVLMQLEQFLLSVSLLCYRGRKW